MPRSATAAIRPSYRSRLTSNGQIVPDIDLATASQINNSNAATYANKTVRIHGAGKKVCISVPITPQRT
jgi:hypothetical protein